MTKKTLHEVGQEAKMRYSQFNGAAHTMETVREHIWPDQSIQMAVQREQSTGENRTPNGQLLPSAAEMRGNNTRIRDNIAEVRPYYDKTVAEGKEFADANAAELHDLAVVEAHLGGVAINVEQPIEIGQKIEVHTPEHQ